MEKYNEEIEKIYKLFMIAGCNDYDIAVAESKMLDCKHQILSCLSIDEKILMFDFEELNNNYEKLLILNVIDFVREYYKQKKH